MDDTYPGSGTPELISCPSHVFEVIRSFDERKKDIVRSIGFTGLLYLSRFKELDPNFSLWLLRKVRWNSCSLHVGENVSFVIRPDDIGKIIGIPYSGIEVSDKAIENEEQKLAFKKLNLSFLGNEGHILESAEQYLGRELPFGFSKEEARKFKVAFIIFVLGRFLSPSLDTSSARSDFWGALKNPDAIHSFNWSSFVLSDTIEASRCIVWDILRNRNVSTILGCPLILQILYLDSIELGHLKLPHDVLPRVKVFNSAVLDKMIEADYAADEISTSKPSYGRTKTLRRDNTCYSFGVYGSSITPHACSTDTPEGNDGQVDPALLDCFRFHQAMCLQHFTKFTNGLKAAITKENISLVSKIVNQQRRCTGLPPINIEVTRPSVTRRTYDEMLSGAESADDTTPAANRKKNVRRVGLLETPPIKKVTPRQRSSTSCKYADGSSSPLFSPNQSFSHAEVDLEENISPKHFTTPLYYNRRKPSHCFKMPTLSPTSENRTFACANFGSRILAVGHGADLNETSNDAEYSNSPITKKVVQPGRLAVPHWARNLDHPTRDCALTRSFYDWLSTTTSIDLKRPWIMHDSPRFIQITGKQLKEHFTHIHPMAYDAFDLCVRRIKQLDKAICPKDVNLRWRHLLESDFSMHVLGGENPANNVSIRHQFASFLLDYDLERCRMFFVPVLVDGLWWCYAWDLKSFTLTINDPSVSQQTDVLVIQKHAGTIQLLNKFLCETILEFYTGWNPKFHECNIVVFRTPDMPIERSNSAFFTLFFIKNYNGTNLVTATSMNALQKFKQYMLYEILEMKENRVNPPSSYVHTLDD